MDKYDDVVIADLEAQVARLEAAAAPLRAALKGRCCTVEIDGGGNATHEPNCPLSSDVGKGWVSPEVKRDVGLALAGIQTCQRCRACVNIATAALDALKGVE